MHIQKVAMMSVNTGVNTLSHRLTCRNLDYPMRETLKQITLALLDNECGEKKFK